MKQIRPADLISQLEDTGFDPLDIREPWALKHCFLSTAQNIALAELPSRIPELKNNTPLLVMCHDETLGSPAVFFVAQFSSCEFANFYGGAHVGSDPLKTQIAIN